MYTCSTMAEKRKREKSPAPIGKTVQETHMREERKHTLLGPAHQVQGSLAR